VDDRLAVIAEAKHVPAPLARAGARRFATWRAGAEILPAFDRGCAMDDDVAKCPGALDVDV
jgi:hypothetical protein